jgi:hypothetical protein
MVTKMKRWEDTYTDAAIRHGDGLRLCWRRLGGSGGGGGRGVGGGGVGGDEAVVGADAAVNQQRKAAEERGARRGHRRQWAPTFMRRVSRGIGEWEKEGSLTIPWGAWAPRVAVCAAKF